MVPAMWERTGLSVPILLVTMATSRRWLTPRLGELPVGKLQMQMSLVLLVLSSRNNFKFILHYFSQGGVALQDLQEDMTSQCLDSNQCVQTLHMDDLVHVAPFKASYEILFTCSIFI